ncbi:MAG: MATE family efflux transporter [Sphingopyxis sp.]|nr:MATE family efflux transporter [Sphingopyxis sp.]
MANGVTQIRRSVLTLALPITVSTLLQRAEGIVAVFLVGGLGATSIAAVGLGQLLAFVATTLVSGLSVGTNVIVAQLWGARRRQDAGEAARHFLWISLGLSLVLAGFGIAGNRLVMQQLGAEPGVIELALPYSTLIFLVIPCTILIQVLSSVLQGVGDTKTPMFAMIGVNLLHAFLAYPLIYGRWGAPNLGIKGAAIAVGLAEATGTLYLLLRCRPILKTSVRLRLDLIRSIWDVGASVSGERVVQQAGIFIYTKLVLLYGTVAYAAHQVGLSIESFSFLPGYGLAIAAATICLLHGHLAATDFRRRLARPSAPVRRVLRQRRAREQFFPADMFADPAWDMLLDLYAAQLEGQPVAVSSLCIAAAVPATTALRWIKTMTDTGLFERQADPRDGRRIFIGLSAQAAQAMERYFAALENMR